jgi:hypothetical protein
VQITHSNSPNAVQLFIRVHNETLSVAMRVNDPDYSPLEIHGDRQPQLHPAYTSNLQTVFETTMT